MTPESAGAAIEKSFAAVAKAGGEPVAPFFSAGSGSISSETANYLKGRGVTVWTAGISSGDKSGASAGQVANGTLEKIRETGKGVVLFHDNSKATVDALDSILTGLRVNGFKVVQAVPVANFSPKNESQTEAENANPFDARSQRTSSMLLDVAKRRVEADGRQRAEAGRRRRAEAAGRRRAEAAGRRRAEAAEGQREVAEQGEREQRRAAVVARKREEQRVARARQQERRMRHEELRRRRAQENETPRRRESRAEAD
jgi:hypothetical protein